MSEPTHQPRSLAGEPWLTRPQTQAVFGALSARGHVSRAVGGAVRNSLLGRPVADVDLATTARPEETIAAAKAAGLAAIATGIEHGTITVVSGGIAHEVTTLRRDVETHGRHATVAFTDDWEADARRRDFTLNALYCAADGEVFDPLGGYADLAAQRVRFIGDADERIREDYLRILRFFRVTAEYAVGPPDAEGLGACVRGREGLVHVSAERVRQEFLRLLAAPRGAELVYIAQTFGLLVAMLGMAPRPGLLAGLAGLQERLDQAPDALLRLAALTIAVPDDAERLQDRLRLSNEECARLASAGARLPDMTADTSEAAAKVRLYALGMQRYRDRVLLSWAASDEPVDHARWRDLLALPDRWEIPRMPVGGEDVIALGVPAGPPVGEVLRALETWWVAGGFSADSGEIRAKLRELVAN